MSEWLIYNGELIERSALPLTAGNRAFRYGDGLFETMRLVAGRVPLWQYHVDRAAKTIEAMGLKIELNADAVLKQIAQLAAKADLQSARIRWSIYRESEGAYLPTDNKASYLIEIAEIDTDNFTLNSTGLTIAVYKEDKKYPGPLANYKTNSAQLYTQAARFAKSQGLDDALILNTKDQIIEATASNIFLLKGTDLHTPPLGNGPIAGVMRRVVFGLAMQHGFRVSSGPVTEQLIKDADELWLTNAVQGIRWVGRMGSKVFQGRQAERMAAHLKDM